MQVGIAVFSEEMKANRLFDEALFRDNCTNRFSVLRSLLEQNGIGCDTLDLCVGKSVDFLIAHRIDIELNQILSAIRNNPQVRILYVPTESPFIVFMHRPEILGRMPFDRVFSWHNDCWKNYSHAVKCPLGQPRIAMQEIPYIPYGNKRFVTGVFSNKSSKSKYSSYAERVNAIQFFAKKEQGFDLYGIGWESNRNVEISRSYKGPCENKTEVMKNYKFSLCFENTTSFAGSVDEKIFDCFASGTVPIYLGDPEIAESIPESCYIDFRKFQDYEHLYRFLTSMTEEQYAAYLDAAKQFIGSQAYGQFTSDRYAEILLEQMQSLMKMPKPTRTIYSFKRKILRAIAAHPAYFLSRANLVRRFIFDMTFVW